jgi:dihydrofolate reductase
MSKVILNISMSLDGFTAGPDIRTEAPMGDNGEKLHDWMFGDDRSSETETVVADFFKNVGAYIMGKRTLELGLGPWGDNPPFHAPCFVLSGKPHDTITKQGGTSFIFVTDGIGSALKQAQEAAGGKDVVVMGGANAARQYLNAGLLDEMHLHLPHVLLGAGTRLFDQLTITPADLEKIAVVDTPGATHIKFRILS